VAGPAGRHVAVFGQFQHGGVGLETAADRAAELIRDFLHRKLANH
jgi:hypothetical protein